MNTHKLRKYVVILILSSGPAAPFSGYVYAADSADDATIEEELVVTGHRRDYRKDVAEAVIGIDLNVLETPAAVSVITQDLLKDQQVNNVDDALRNVAGVTKFKTGNGGEEKFSIRGFDASQSIYKDGARINNPLNASNIPSTETANIERIEVLKGPSALLYGQGEPGGIIQYVTKRPQLRPYASVEVLAGSESYGKIETDVTGAFGDSDAFAYRLVGTYEDSDSFRNEVFRERLLVNPSVAFMPSDSSQVVLGYEFIDDQYTQDRGQVLDGNDISGYFYSDRLNHKQFFGIPDWNRNTTAESSRLYLLAEHRVNAAWRLDLSFNRTDVDKVNFDSSPFSIDPATGAKVGPVGTPIENLAAIQPRKSDGEGSAEQWKIGNTIEFTDGLDWEHTILASFTHEAFSTESTGYRGDQAVLFNVATGEYFDDPDTPVAPDAEEIRINDNLVFGLRSRGFSTNQDFEERGINVLDYIRFSERWAWLIGGRLSEFNDNRGSYEDDNFSARTGVVYSPRSNLSFYTSYSEGYTSSGGREKMDGGQADPETSLALELGAKLQLLDERLLLTATVFDVDKEDVVYVTNPDDPQPFFDNFGAFNSKGFEFEMVGQLTEQWRIQAGYARIDTEITEGGQDQYGNRFPVGNEIPGIADDNVNLFTFYDFAIAGGQLGLGGGFFHQSDVFISIENQSKYDSWTQFDLAAYYKRADWKFQLNVSNLTDEEYRLTQAFISDDIFAAGRVGTSSPRSVTASVAYEF